MIQKISITNFKAILHCLNLPLQPFTAFTGENGSGKSSIIEALRIFAQVGVRKMGT